jgi:glycosyltransferase involved in cell wall biosynthesis
VVDELVVAIARGGPDDGTRDLVASIADSRIRILDAVWDDSRRHLAYSDLTNEALDACTGDWCLYIQADEVLHEDDHATVRARCDELLADRRVDGMLFDYLHFFGDYEHLQRGQGWYAREIRLVRNRAGVRSVRDAQSFRRPPQKRLTVARSGARIFHYGWARHPRLMQEKIRAFWAHRLGERAAEARYAGEVEFDYGPLGRLERWHGTHPRVMAERIAAMDWRDRLREVDPPGLGERARHRDEQPLYRFLTALSHVTGVDFNHKNHGRVLDV